jgi:ribosomal protein S18 acetylase RimI-like enzyme
MKDQLRIRPMVPADLPAVAEVHCAAFRGFFLDAMGHAFLRAYYGVVLRYAGSVALVAEDAQGKPVGFAAGFLDPSAFYVFLKSQWLRLVPGAVLGLARRPQLLGRVLLNRSRVKEQGRAAPARTTVELASIAAAARAGGIGSRLMAAFIDEAARVGGHKIALTTDAKGNSEVQSFYRKHGFQNVGIEMRGEREMLCLERDLHRAMPA